MNRSAADILSELLLAEPQPTSRAPNDARGIYGLYDHTRTLRYIGSTCSISETFYKRIHQRHRSGSESTSHYFSRMYNSGRMWRDRDDKTTTADGLVAKKLRNEFISDHCSAVWISVPDNLDILGLEREVLAIAPAHATAWNGRKMKSYDEPVELVGRTIERLGWGTRELEAIKRQNLRYRTSLRFAAPASVQTEIAHSRYLPSGAFRFVALDVETANNDRSSICQIGIACVKDDGTIVTWSSYIEPNTPDWSCTRIHGITAETVRNAPSYTDLFQDLARLLSNTPVYQHSGFDRSAISAACSKAGISEPRWEWRDSISVAQRAWPELKGQGGYGLASLKRHLGLRFRHHDAEEDARAAAEIVLAAEKQIRFLPRGHQIERPVSPSTINALTNVSPQTITATPSNRSHNIVSSTNNPTRDALIARIASLDDATPHPSQRDINGTKYISAFTIGGSVFAVDKASASKQPVWVVDRGDIREHLDSEAIDYEVYKSDRTRNSNLHKLPNFKNGQLLRVYPSTVDQALGVITKLAKQIA